MLLLTIYRTGVRDTGRYLVQMPNPIYTQYYKYCNLDILNYLCKLSSLISYKSFYN